MEKKKYSYLWNFFLISDADAGKAMCYLCNHILSYKTSISNLKKHLSCRHPEIQIQANSVVIHQDVADILNKNAESLQYNDHVVKVESKRKRELKRDLSIVKLKKVESELVYPQKVESEIVYSRKADPAYPDMLTNDIKKSLDNHLLSLFFKDLQKITVVEDPGFQSFIKALNAEYKIPDSKTILGNLLPEMYNKIKLHVDDALQDSLSVTLTVDSWTSSHHEQLVSVKAHFLDSNFDVLSVLLDCYSFSEQATNEKLNDVLRNVATKWFLNDKITLIISNTVFEQTTEEQVQWEYINCVIHTVNIISASSLEVVSPLLLKVQCIVSCYKQNSFATFELQKAQENLGKEAKDLVLSNTTDWYSIFKMLCRFVELEEVIKLTLSHLDVSLTFLSNEEWVICREIVEVIKPFEVLIKSLSDEKYISSSLAIILAKGLENMLKELSLRNFSSLTHAVLAKCIEEVTGHFAYLYTNNILLISTFLDPRFKDVIFEPNVREELKQSVANIISANMLAAKEQTIAKTDSSINDDALSIWTAFQSKAQESRPPHKKDSRASIEIQQYLEDILLPRSENPMQWWKINGHMYPHLKNLMKQNLAITCSAVPCDYLFSKHLQQLNDRRSQLSVEEAKLLLFIKNNQHLIKLND